MPAPPTTTIAPLLGTAGASALLGGITGYAAKKLAKLGIILAGAATAALAALDHAGLIDAHWTAIADAAANTTTAAAHAAAPLSAAATAALPATGGFTLGALVGFKKG